MKSFFSGASSNVRKAWEDSDDKPLELNLDDIVTEFIVSGERRYREASQRRYDWQLQSKAAINLQLMRWSRNPNDLAIDS